MPDSNPSDVTARPFTSFNFAVRIQVDGSELCDAAFSECSGLETTMEPKTYREGGNNVRQYQLPNPVSYGQLTLRRGMTDSFDLWRWFDRTNRSKNYGTGALIFVDVLSTDGAEAEATFRLTHGVPVKMKAPDLKAQEGGIAIEEMQIAYERLKLERPGSSSSTTDKPDQIHA